MEHEKVLTLSIMTGVRSLTITKEKWTTEPNQTYFDSKVVSQYISPEQIVTKRKPMGKIGKIKLEKLNWNPVPKRKCTRSKSQNNFHIQWWYEKGKLEIDRMSMLHGCHKIDTKCIKQKYAVMKKVYIHFGCIPSWQK
jgi:hypothetical protein